MNEAKVSECPVPESSLQPLFIASNTSVPDAALERLIETARSAKGRSDLASNDILPTVLNLFRSLSYPSCRETILLSLKLLRNLCAGELRNQTSFVELDGVQIICQKLSFIREVSASDYGIIRMALQVLANVSLAGEDHRKAIWHICFPLEFIEIAKLRSRDTCDPLCMIIYICSEGNSRFTFELCADIGLPILAEIIHTASEVGFGEDWLKLLISRTCIEETHFFSVFSKLAPFASSRNEDLLPRDDSFTPEQAFLLGIVSEILNERMGDITISAKFATSVVEIFQRASRVVNSVSEVKPGLPSGSTDIDVLGYSLSILRDICACDGLGEVIDSLLSSSEILDLLLDLLRELEPPSTIKKAMKGGEGQEEGKVVSGKIYPYKGFRKDIVAVIGNCAYKKKHVQDSIREKNGILLMLQQCVVDEDNMFLREWGIFAVRNLLEGNAENQRVVSELEVQGSVDLPELSGLGLRVEVDEITRRAKLVNIS